MEKQQIYLAMHNIMKKVRAIGKERNNQKQNFKYRGVDDVMNELHPLFVEEEVVLSWDVVHKEHMIRQVSEKPMAFTTLTVRYRFTSSLDGSFMETTTVGAAGDSYDKDTSKAQAMALKYLLYHTFLIETGEDDPDGDTPGTTKAPAEPKIASEKQINYLRSLANEADKTGKLKLTDGVAIREVIANKNADEVDRWIKQLKQ